MHHKLVIAQAIGLVYRAEQDKGSACALPRSGRCLGRKHAVELSHHLPHGKTLDPRLRVPGHLVGADKPPALADSCDVTKSVILGGWYLGLSGPKP